MTADTGRRTAHLRYRELKIPGMNRWRYRELQAYCRQYPEWARKAEGYLQAKTQILSDMPKATRSISEVEYAVLKREKYLQRMQIIEQCAKEADPCLHKAIIQNVCYGKSFGHLQGVAYCGNRNKFFRARRAFFVLLHEKLNEV